MQNFNPYGNPYGPYSVRQQYLQDDDRLSMLNVLQNVGNWIRNQQAQQQVLNDYAPAQRYYNSGQYQLDRANGLVY